MSIFLLSLLIASKVKGRTLNVVYATLVVSLIMSIVGLSACRKYVVRPYSVFA